MEVRKVERRLIENANGMFTVPPRRIVYAYFEYQPLFDVMKRTIPNIIFHQGLPDREDLENHSEGLDHVILVLDDLMLKITQSEDCAQLFTVTSHHRNCPLSDAKPVSAGKIRQEHFVQLFHRNLVPKRKRQKTGVDICFSEPSGSNRLLQRCLRTVDRQRALRLHIDRRLATH